MIVLKLRTIQFLGLFKFNLCNSKNCLKLFQKMELSIKLNSDKTIILSFSFFLRKKKEEDKFGKTLYL